MLTKEPIKLKEIAEEAFKTSEAGVDIDSYQFIAKAYFEAVADAMKDPNVNDVVMILMGRWRCRSYFATKNMLKRAAQIGTAFTAEEFINHVLKIKNHVHESYKDLFAETLSKLAQQYRDSDWWPDFCHAIGEENVCNDGAESAASPV